MKPFSTQELKSSALATWAAVSAVALSMATTNVARADSVTTRSKITIEGELVRYDDEAVSIRQMTSDRIFTYKASEVARVEAKLTPAHEAAEQAFEGSDFEAAVRGYRRALGEEKRAWALGRIRGKLIEAQRRSGDLEKAGEDFLQLAAGREDAGILARAPLIWLADEKVPPAAITAARNWLNDSNPIARLIGCSWLIGTPYRGEAMPVLTRLETIPDQRVSWLARAQKWRTRYPPTSPDEANAIIEDAGRFANLIERMPDSIRVGPQFMLGQAYEWGGRHADAALSYLWIVYVLDAPPDLAAESLLRAARSSREAGFADDAEKLFKQVEAKHPETRWAKAAAGERNQSKDVPKAEAPPVKSKPQPKSNP